MGLQITIADQKYFSYKFKNQRYAGGELINKPPALKLEDLKRQEITVDEFHALPKFNSVFACTVSALKEVKWMVKKESNQL